MSAPCPVFGFFVRTRLRPTATDFDADTLIDDLAGLLEVNGLRTDGGGRSLACSVYREGTQATHTDRELVMAWAARWTHLADISVSDLVDLSQG